MQIQREDLDEAAARRIVDASQAAELWRFFGERQPARARFTGVNVSYFFGALVVIAAMGWLMTLGFEQLGPGGLASSPSPMRFSSPFSARGCGGAPISKIPGGLLYTMAVCMTPLAIWGLEKGTGFWPAKDPGHYRDFYPYIAAAGPDGSRHGPGGHAGAAQGEFSFLVAPAAVALWFMSMDLAAYLAATTNGSSRWAARVDRVPASGCCSSRTWSTTGPRGLCLLALSVRHDRPLGRDQPSMDSAASGDVCCLHDEPRVIVLSVLLRRRVFLVYGAIGVNAYLVRLA